MNPTEDVATHIAGLVLGLTVGTNLFMGPVRAQSESVPAAAVFVHSEGGDAPEPYLGTGTSDWQPEVTVTVRGAPEAFQTGQTLARSILKALHLADVPGYYLCEAQQSEPDYVGRDDAGCPEWEMDFVLGYVG